jgi:hypothetical protein
MGNPNVLGRRRVCDGGTACPSGHVSDLILWPAERTAFRFRSRAADTVVLHKHLQLLVMCRCLAVVSA